MAVLSHLPSADVCNLRLASRCVASCSGPKSLPTSFWQSRFEGENEMAFYGVFVPPSISPVEWPLLYTRLRARLNIDSGHRVRRRIWRVLGDLGTTLKMLIRYGPVVASSSGLGGARRTSDSDPLKLSLSRPSVDQSLGVSVSFLHFDQQRVVCGIRTTAVADTTATPLAQMGMINPETEQSIIVPPGHDVFKVKVVYSAMGIVGLRFLHRPKRKSVNVSDPSTWETTGVKGALCNGLATMELDVDRVSRQVYFEADVRPLTFSQTRSRGTD